LLRDAVTDRTGVVVEAASEASQVTMFYWTGAPKFEGILEAIATKYTLFLSTGLPVRATMHLQMSTPSRATSKTDAKKGGEAASKPDKECSSGSNQ